MEVDWSARLNSYEMNAMGDMSDTCDDHVLQEISHLRLFHCNGI
jgi:hypothetical protein